MTIAICLKCGSVKGGAFVPCPGCGFIPETEDEMIHSFVLTDHTFSDIDLERIGAQIKDGHTPKFEIDDDSKQRMRAALKLLGAQQIVHGQGRSTN